MGVLSVGTHLLAFVTHVFLSVCPSVTLPLYLSKPLSTPSVSPPLLLFSSPFPIPTHTHTHTHTHSHTLTHTNTHTHTHTHTLSLSLSLARSLSRAACAFDTADQNCSYAFTTPVPDTTTLGFSDALNCSDAASTGYFSENSLSVASEIIDCCCDEANAVTYVSGDVTFAASTVEINPSIGYIGGNVGVASGGIGGLGLIYTTYIGGNVNLNGVGLFEYPGFFSLLTVGGYMDVSNNDFSSIDIDSLTSVGGDLDLSNNGLEFIILENTLTVSGQIDLGYNAAGFALIANGTIMCDYIDLVETSVDYAECNNNDYCLAVSSAIGDNYGCDLCEG